MVNKRRNSCKGSPELSFAAVAEVLSVKYQQNLGVIVVQLGFFRILLELDMNSEVILFSGSEVK